MSNLAKEVDMDKGQLSRKIGAMVAKGLVQTTPNEADQRKQDVQLTAKALDISDAMMPLMQKRQDRLVERVSEEELAVFFKVLKAIDEAAEIRDIE